MGLTKKDVQECRDTFGASKRSSIHVRKDSRLNLHRNIVRMFSDIDDNR